MEKPQQEAHSLQSLEHELLGTIEKVYASLCQMKESKAPQHLRPHLVIPSQGAGVLPTSQGLMGRSWTTANLQEWRDTPGRATRVGGARGPWAPVSGLPHPLQAPKQVPSTGAVSPAAKCVPAHLLNTYVLNTDSEPCQACARM